MEAYVGRGRGERGAILIQVAISIMALTAFTAFVVDYGVLWVARGQAQNAADAGALAGAIAREFDDIADPPVTMIPFNSAKLAAQCASRSAGCPTTAPYANPVWPSQAGAISIVDPSWDCPPTFSGKCVQVNVYRDGSHGSTALPTFVAPIIGVMSQGVRATATAIVGSANTVNCMRPFAIADRWIERITANQYNKWQEVGGVAQVIPGTHDDYVAPDANGPGSGYHLPEDYGVPQTLIPASNGTDILHLGVGWSLVVALPDGAGGWDTGNAIRTDIRQCLGHPVSIGQYLPTENAGTGLITGGFDDLRDQDPNATWTNGQVANSCAPGSCPKYPAGSGTVNLPISPRIVPIALFDMDDFQFRESSNPPNRTNCPTGGSCVKVVNILGYFAASRSGSTINGYLMRYPGTFRTGKPSVGGTGAFLTSIGLVR